MGRLLSMKSSGSAGGPGSNGNPSWTDEMLPMGIRKELLERELQSFMARKRQTHTGAPNQDTGAQLPSGDHPQAGDAEERAS